LNEFSTMEIFNFTWKRGFSIISEADSKRFIRKQWLKEYQNEVYKEE